MKIGLLGCGVVGQGVLEIIDQMDGPLKVKRILVKTKEECVDGRMTTDINDIWKDKSIDVIVECMGGIEPALSFVKTALKNKKHVVTSNKKMLATSYEELIKLARKNHCHFHYEACVGGGIPWIHELEHVQRVDKIQAFTGIFNGTTNYILSNMEEKNLSFATALKQAQKLGYAEQDPTDDVDGYDVRYKLLLSVVAGMNQLLELDEIPMVGIRNITKEDIEMAKKMHRHIRFIAKAKKNKGSISVSVRPTLLKEDSLFSHIQSNFNGMCIDSTYLGPSFYVGQGAGRYPTAHAVVQDIVDLTRAQVLELPEKGKVNKTDQNVYYIRTSQKGIWEDIIEKQMKKNVFISKKVTWKNMSAHLSKDHEAFIAEVEI